MNKDLESLELKDANPSEALERYHNGDVLVSRADSLYEDEYLILEDNEEYQTIKQALLKEQKLEKVLEIIKNIIKFGDDLNSILDFDTYEEYSEHSDDCDYELIQEEFDLLRRYLNDSRTRN